MRKAIPTLLLLGFTVSISCGRGNETTPQPTQPTSTAAQRQNPSAAATSSVPLTYTPSDFNVMFDGLIVIAKMASGDIDTPRRAILVRGEPSMVHIPLLIVDAPSTTADQTQLADEFCQYTGNTLNCADPYHPKKCTGNITGADLRIRGDGESIPPRPLAYDSAKTFEHLLPSIKDLAEDAQNPGRNAIWPELLKTETLPAPPTYVCGSATPGPAVPLTTATKNVAAFFEIDGGGTLAACPFDDPDLFDNDPQSCRQFARETSWSGTANGRAVLQIRSAKTPPIPNSTDHEWKTLEVKNAGWLNIEIKNEPPEGTTMPTPTHFPLFDKVLRGGHVPHVLGKNCSGAKIWARCAGPEVLVPGCSDTQYP